MVLDCVERVRLSPNREFAGKEMQKKGVKNLQQMDLLTNNQMSTSCSIKYPKKEKEMGDYERTKFLLEWRIRESELSKRDETRFLGSPDSLVRHSWYQSSSSSNGTVLLEPTNLLLVQLATGGFQREGMLKNLLRNQRS